MYNHDLDRKQTDNKFYGNYRGAVVDDQDPMKVGRVRIRVFGIYDNVADDVLPWALYADPFMGGQSGTGGFFIPDVNSHVWVFFENGDHMQPVYFAGAPSAVSMPEDRLTSTHEDSKGGISYPRAKVFITKAGHKFEIDDTEGNERVTFIHKSGSQYTYQANGDVYEHVTGNYKRIVDGNLEETITGSMTSTVSGATTIEYSADLTLKSGANLTLEAGGNATVTASTIQLN